MKRLTTDSPSGNFETMLNFVYGKDGWAYIRHDGEHADVMLTDWAKRQCKLRGCDEPFTEPPEEIDQQLCDCMMDEPICPIAMAYCFASQAIHLRSRLKMHEDAMPLERAQELAQAEKDGRLVVLEPAAAAKKGVKKPTCFYNDMGQEFCLGFGRGRDDDEPIDTCKECWYCEFSSVREEAEEALKKREER